MEEIHDKKTRGRPKKNQGPTSHTQYRAVLDIEPNEDNAKGVIERESCFVLVHTGKKPLSAREIMSAYKGQVVVETRFPFLKDPAWADVFFIKTPHRLEALGYVLLLALLVWCVWERRVRANLKQSGEDPLVDTTGMKKKNPTAKVCRHVMASIKVMRMKIDGAFSPWHQTAPLKAEQKRVLRFSQATPGAVRLTVGENRGFLL